MRIFYYLLLSFKVIFSGFRRCYYPCFLLFIINSIVLLAFLHIKPNIKRGKRGNKAPNTTTTKKGIKRTHPTPRTQNHTFYIVPHPQFCLILSFPSTVSLPPRTHTHNGRFGGVCCWFAVDLLEIAGKR